ncbi:hypothetical protein MMC07_005767 [Pseudocyphellaria aurata]|nr:hypothetical protein [Pseudocyphellaria aurata]
MPTLLAHNGPDEVKAIVAGVETVATKVGIDPRVAFAVAMQQSNGMLRRQRRNFNRIGLFQVISPNAASCEGTKVNECSAKTITQMAEDGIYGHPGTTWGPRKPGLAFWINEQEDIALGLRAYNSGGISNANDLTIIPSGERGYVSDVANRLVGAKFGSRRRFTC